MIRDVKTPSWLHKYIIGKKGENVKKITQDLPKVHIEFTDGEDKIVVEGPPEEVEDAYKQLEDMTKDMVSDNRATLYMSYNRSLYRSSIEESDNRNVV